MLRGGKVEWVYSEKMIQAIPGRKTLAILTLALALGGCNKPEPSPAEDKKAAEVVDFTGEVKPLLTSTCLPCHHSGTLLGGLNLESRKTAFGGEGGAAFIVPGEPDNSLLYLVTENPHGKRPAFEKMPAMKDIFLTDKERSLLRRWIEQGANWPSGDDGWLQPIKAPNGES